MGWGIEPTHVSEVICTETSAYQWGNMGWGTGKKKTILYSTLTVCLTRQLPTQCFRLDLMTQPSLPPLETEGLATHRQPQD